MTDVPKNGDEDAKALARVARHPFAMLLVAALIPSGVAGYGSNGISTKLDALLATVQDLKAAVAALQGANLDARVRALELGAVERKATDDTQSRRIEALEARAR